MAPTLFVGEAKLLFLTMLFRLLTCRFFYHSCRTIQISNYGGLVSVPEKTGEAVPSSGRMKAKRERRSPANLMAWKAGTRLNARLNDLRGPKDC